MPLYELTLTQAYRGQTLINRFNYELTGTPAGISGSLGLLFACGFIDDAGVYPAGTLFAAIRDVQVGGVTYSNAVAFNLYDPVDFFSTPFLAGTTGTGAGSEGNEASPALAVSYRSSRSRRDINRGRKAFSGLHDDYLMDGGGFDPSWFSGPAETLRLALGSSPTWDDEGNILTYSPIIVSKEKVVLDPGPPERITYRYYETEAEQLQHIMNATLWETRTTVRTQRSRQFGYGV